MDRTKHILVTGATGFIGSHLVDRLVQDDTRLTLYLRRRTERVQTWEQQGARIVQGDGENPPAMQEAMADVTHVVHLAGATKAPTREAYDHANRQFTENLLATTPGHVKFLYVSSQAAAGPGDLARPRRETDPEQPKTWYGQSKRAGEQAVLQWARRTGGEWTILRPSAVYGPRERDLLQLFRWIDRGMAVQDGAAEYRYRFIHVFDLVEAIGRTLGQPARNEIYFVCNDREAPTAADLNQAIADALGASRVLRLKLPRWVFPTMAWLGEQFCRPLGKTPAINRQKLLELRDHWICSSEKFRSDFGWEPKLDLAEGIAQTARWWRQKGRG